MIRVHLPLVTLAAVAGLGFAACSSDENGGGGARDGGGGKAGVTNPKCGETGAPTCVLPPTPPTGGTTPPDTTPPTVIAINELYLGDTDRQGNPSDTAWRQFGYNLDGLISTENGTNHCKLAESANPAATKPDGEGGIDNAFGLTLIPLIDSVAGGVGTAINDSINRGDFTVMIRLQNLADPATTPTQTGVKASVIGGALFGAGLPCGDGGAGDAGSTPGDGGSLTNCSPPKFDGTDSWPLARETLLNANPATPKVTFDNSFVSNGTWVGTGAQVDLTISIGGVTLTLNIVSAYIAVDLTGVQQSAKGTKGTIAGVVNTAQFIDEIRSVIGNVSPTLCGGTTFESIAQQIRAASDIMSDGTNGDPLKSCDAISVGFGFDAAAVLEGPVAPEAPAPPDPCADSSM